MVIVEMCGGSAQPRFSPADCGLRSGTMLRHVPGSWRSLPRLSPPFDLPNLRLVRPRCLGTYLRHVQAPWQRLQAWQRQDSLLHPASGIEALTVKAIICGRADIGYEFSRAAALDSVTYCGDCCGKCGKVLA